MEKQQFQNFTLHYLSLMLNIYFVLLSKFWLSLIRNKSQFYFFLLWFRLSTSHLRIIRCFFFFILVIVKLWNTYSGEIAWTFCPFQGSYLYNKITWIVKLHLSLSLSLRERESWHWSLCTTPHHRKLFKDLRVDLNSSVIHHWNHQLKPHSFQLRKNSVN